MSITVKACPRCGRRFLNHCWHSDTEELPTVEMPLEKAKELLQKTIDSAYYKLEGLRGEMERYTNREEIGEL